MAYSFAQLEALWLEASGPSSSAAIAAAVALAESGGNPDAVSSTGDYGLWQINAKAHPQYDVARLLEPFYNAQAAVAISGGGSNWRPWCTAYTDGACGTRGGTFAPYGASPSGRIYQANRGVPPGGTVGPVGTAGLTPSLQHRPHQTGATGPVGQPLSVLATWRHLTEALGKTLPTQDRRARAARNLFMKAVR